MDRTPSLGEIIGDRISDALRSVFSCLPARVESYDASRQKAVVQPLIYQSYTDEGGNRVVEKLPAIPDVPVVFFGAGPWSITAPIERGDLVTLFFTSCSLDRWLARGGEVDPGDDRRGDLTDALAFPGIRPFTDSLSSPPSDRIRIGGAGAAIEVTATEALIGGGSGHEAAIKGDTYISAKSTMLSAVSAAIALISNIPGLTEPQIAIVTAATAAITAFNSASASYKTLLAKVK